MNLQIEIPQEVLRENLDIFDQFSPEQLSALHAIIYGTDLMMLRRSGSLKKLQEAMEVVALEEAKR
jgi:hypothetical protein